MNKVHFEMHAVGLFGFVQLAVESDNSVPGNIHQKCNQ